MTIQFLREEKNVTINYDKEGILLSIANLYSVQDN